MVKLIYSFSLLFVLGLLGAGYYFLEHEYKPFLNSPLKPGADSLVYNFTPGSSINKLINELTEKKIITKPKYFKAYVRLSVDSRKFQVGIYEIKPDSHSPKDLIKMLQDGRVKRLKVRLPEGWRVKYLLKRISKNKDLKQPESEITQEMVKRELRLKMKNLEGMLYPDTYMVQPGMSALKLIELANQTMIDKLQKEWDRRSKAAQVKTPYEALILASIIEKETAREDEKPIISAVFNNRLKKKMRLQTDPTIIYGMGDKFKGNLTKKDLRTDTPYNTYTRHGLPPTPICAPSLSSIIAALNPADNKALFFVAKGDGNHYFSNNYKEHLKAVMKYQIEPFKKRQKEKRQKELLAKQNKDKGLSKKLDLRPNIPELETPEKNTRN